MKKLTKVMIFALVAMLVLTSCGKKEPSATEGLFKPGTYEVEVDGYGGKMKVATTLSADKIEKVEVLEHGETDGIGTNAVAELPGKIVEGQTLNVEAVTGATVSSTAILDAVKQAIKDAGGDPDALMNAAEGKESGEAVVEETDVVVVGGGGAGLSAAVSAAQEGAKVILVEKTGALGGNTIRAGGPYNAVDPERQKNVPAADENSMAKIMALTEKEAKSPRHQELMDELKKDIEEYNNGPKDHLFDSKALHKLQTYDGGDYVGQLEFIEKLVDESLETSEWMAGNGVKWTDDITTVPGGLWPRAHLPVNSAGKDYIDAGEHAATELGVKIMLNSPAEELIVEDGKVVGIKGTTDGAPLEIRAKVVVLATGGFAANTEMRKLYNPDLGEQLPTTNSPAITGDGIKMAEAVDANTVGMEYIQCLPLGNPENGGLNAWVGGSGVEYYYQVNKSGERFMAEDGRRDVMTAALLAQEDSMSYVISGGNNKIEVGTKDGLNIWGDNVDELVEKGIVFRADTIEDLAKQIGVDPAVLKETNDKFNSYVESKNDPDFGRTLFGDKIVAPFYASKRVPTVHHTMGGVQIDLQNHVINKDGKVVEGLLAAGEVTGGIHGSNRLGGNALVDIHVFGRSAGQEAAKIALGK